MAKRDVSFKALPHYRTWPSNIASFEPDSFESTFKKTLGFSLWACKKWRKNRVKEYSARGGNEKRQFCRRTTGIRVGMTDFTASHAIVARIAENNARATNEIQ